MSDFIALGDSAWRWSRKTFGDRSALAPIRHLKREVLEMEANPKDLEEYADGLLLILDASRRAGHSPAQLLKAAWVKLAKNRKRKWGPPNAEGFSEHIEEPLDPAKHYYTECNSPNLSCKFCTTDTRYSKRLIHPCGCHEGNNGSQCYNCLNGAHSICEGRGRHKCRKPNDASLGLPIVVKRRKKVGKHDEDYKSAEAGCS